MRDRIVWLDNLKGFLIFIVVLGHTILFTNNDIDSNIFYRYIASFWMALFMFTSGFASYKANTYYIIWRCFKQLIVPFICWSIILCMINKEANIFHLLLYPSESVWFLWALFFIKSIVIIACKIAKLCKISEEKLCFAIVIFLLLSTKMCEMDNKIFTFNLISLHSSNFIIGYFVRKHFNIVLSQPNGIWYIGGGMFLIMAYFNQGDFMPFGLPSSFHIIYDMVCSWLSFMLFVPIFRKFISSASLLSKWGGRL